MTASAVADALLADLEAALREHALAIAGQDALVLERANTRLLATVEQIRARRAEVDERCLSVMRARLQAQAELLARAGASNRLALESLALPVVQYPRMRPEGSARRPRTHVIA